MGSGTPITKPGYGRGRKPGNFGKTYPAEPLRPAEVKALIAAAGRGRRGVQNKALIAAMYRGGLRIAEALALEPKDVDLENGTINVLHGKGDKRRTVGIDAGAVALLRQWLAERPKEAGPVFCAPDGGPLWSSSVRGMLRRAAKAAGLDRRVHPHALRHALAAEMAREGIPMRLIQMQLGHASLSTTDRYLRTIAPEEVITAVHNRKWSADE